MFKNLRTSTKLFLLCSVFVGALLAATYALVADKQTAIQFVRNELVGVQKLEALRRAYAFVLTEEQPAPRVAEIAPRTAGMKTPPNGSRDVPAQIETGAPSSLAVARFDDSLAQAIQRFSSTTDAEQKRHFLISVLAAARSLASRIGEESNFALDPDLDSYYLQDILVQKMPSLLSEIGELQSQLQKPSEAEASFHSPTVRAVALEGMIRSTIDEIKADLAGSYRGTHGTELRETIYDDFEAMASASHAYLDTAKASLAGASSGAALDRSYTAAVDRTVKAWSVAQAELGRLLNIRLTKLLDRLRGNLLLNGLLAAFALGFALITARHIVQPLSQLERLADEVGQTKDYRLRAEYESGDEIGRLAGAFNAMLAELSAAREREVADAERAATVQGELARVSRVTSMGVMAASIAHEINQPLAAIVNNASASLRWLDRRPANVERARSVLKRVVDDGERASEVIRSIRGMLQKDSGEGVLVDVNELIREVTTLARADLSHHGVTVRTDLDEGLPRITAVRIQLQQVILNLISNAVEAMTMNADRARVLSIRSRRSNDYGILLTVEDTGTGIAQANIEHMFEPFFSTKPEGMGMGLSICQSIIEGHGGRISIFPGDPNGTVLQVHLPGDEPSRSL